MRNRPDKLARALHEALFREVGQWKEPEWHPTLAELEAYCKGETSAKLKEQLRDHFVVCRGCSDLLLVCRESPNLQAEFERFLTPDPAVTANMEREGEVDESWRELNEADLIQRIQERLPQDLETRYRVLVAKRVAESLAPFEYEELLNFSNQIERLEAQRLEALVRLARLREVSFDALVKKLGL